MHYASAIQSVRDTTKWLVSVASVASGAVPALLVASRQEATGAPGANSLVIGTMVLMFGIALIVWMGKRVLTSMTPGFDQIYDGGDGPIFTKAIVAGAGAPHFNVVNQFDAAFAAIHQTAPDNLQDENNRRVEAAVLRIQEYALYERVKKHFNEFWVGFIVGLLSIVIGAVLLTQNLDQLNTAPQRVRVLLDATGEADLLSSTECTDPSMTTFVLVAGSWSEPTLRVAGDTCSVGALWSPNRDAVVVFPYAE